MLKIYESPELDFLKLSIMDIITVSNDGNPNDDEGTNSDLAEGQHGVVDGGGI